MHRRGITHTAPALSALSAAAHTVQCTALLCSMAYAHACLVSQALRPRVCEHWHRLGPRVCSVCGTYLLPLGVPLHSLGRRARHRGAAWYQTPQFSTEHAIMLCVVPPKVPGDPNVVPQTIPFHRTSGPPAVPVSDRCIQRLYRKMLRAVGHRGIRR